MPIGNKWPFTPNSLSDIIKNQDVLAAIKSGSIERLQRTINILDYDFTSGDFLDRIPSIDEYQRYEPFCRLLRNETVISGASAMCKKCADEKAIQILNEYKEDNNPYHEFVCHMGLKDVSYLILVANKPVAIMISGQFLPDRSADPIKDNVRTIGTGDLKSMHIFVEEKRTELLSLADQIDHTPTDIYDRIQREAEQIQEVAETIFRNNKYEQEQNFIDEIRHLGISGTYDNKEQLSQVLVNILERVADFCGCAYAALFASHHENDNVLPLMAQRGISDDRLMAPIHFNWKKAGLPIEGNINLPQMDLKSVLEKALATGIRGESTRKEGFSNAGCVVPFTLARKYRGALVLGPFVEQFDIGEEKRFLIEIGHTIGAFALTELEMLHLASEKSRWESTATLLSHQLRSALTPISNSIGRAVYKVNHGKEGNQKDINVLLERATTVCLQLGKSAKRTLDGHVLLFDKSDLIFERYSLAALVQNCADGFDFIADTNDRDIVIDQSVELLPETAVDVPRLMIALGNIIENAIKYSFPKTDIYVKARTRSIAETRTPTATVFIENIGREVKANEKKLIFEQGVRGLSLARMARIPGHGMGLWEARAVVEAHNGKIGVECQRTAIRRRQGTAYRVTFSVELPIIYQ